MAILTTTRFTSRVAGTAYQNTTGGTIIVEALVQSSSGADVIALSDAANPPTTQVARHVGHNSDSETLLFVVPNNFYWKITCLAINETHESLVATTVTDSGDLSATRALDTAYHNTGGSALLLIVQLGSVNTRALQASSGPSNPPTITVFSEGATGGTATLVILVPAGEYYLATQNSGGATITSWHEWSMGFGVTRSANLAGAGRGASGIYQNTDAEARYVTLFGSAIGTGTTYLKDDTVTPPAQYDYAITQTGSGEDATPSGFVAPNNYYSADRDTGFSGLSAWYEYALTPATAAVTFFSAVTLAEGTPDADFSQLTLAPLAEGAPVVGVSQFTAAAFSEGSPVTGVSQFLVCVLADVTLATPPAPATYVNVFACT